MTAVVVAMLAIVVVATIFLAAVGGYHHLSHSRRTQRRVRRWRYLARTRLRGAEDRLVMAMLALRRTVAGRLGRSGAVGAVIRRAVPH